VPLLVLIAATAFFRQEIPAGIRYKKASCAVNKIALAKLTKFYASSMDNPAMTGLSSEALICGPTLWNALKAGAPEDLQSTTKAQFYIPTGGGMTHLEGRVLKTEYSQSAIWLALLLLRDKQNVKPTLRKANSEELKYYWAIIPYDIVEPLYIADYGKTQVLFNFAGDAKDPRVMFVDFIPRMKK